MYDRYRDMRAIGDVRLWLETRRAGLNQRSGFNLTGPA